MLKKTLIAAGLAAASASAFAAAAPVMNAGMPWYVGVGVDTTPAWTNESSTNKIKSRSVGGNVFVGYHVNKYFGTELGLDVNSNYKTKSKTTGATTLTQKSRWNLHGVVNAYLPVNSWFSPFGFAGAAWTNYKTTNSTGATTTKYAGLDGVYGGGVQFNIEQFGIRVKYTRFTQLNNLTASATDAPLDLVSLDVLYRFGM